MTRLAPPTVIGIDDWAWRRNQRYGTIICDLERRRTIALLPDREPMTARAWLAAQPQIAVVARDRGGGYALAAAGALPEATQVADCWHLMENASRAFLDAVRTSMRQIRSAMGAVTIDVALLTAAARIQYEGYLRREEANATILRLKANGMPIKEIMRRTGHSRGLVRKVVRGQRTDLFRTRESSLEAHLPWLEEQLVGGIAQRRRAVAAAPQAWLSRLLAGRHGMGNPSPPDRTGTRRGFGPSSLGTHGCPPAERRPRCIVQVGDAHGRGDRDRGTAAGRSSRAHCRLPGHDPQASRCRTRHLGRTSPIQPRRLLRHRRHERRSGGDRGAQPVLVQR